MPPPDVLPALLAQRRHQIRARRASRIGALLVAVVGVALSAIGLYAAAARWGEGLRPSTLALIVLIYGLLLFGGVLVALLAWSFGARCRIVPYFARELGRYPGDSSVAFRRGHALYLNSVALEQFALAHDVRPLSAFGFGDDLYGQAVPWSPASEGLRTIAALRAAPSLGAAVAADLDALGAVLRIAAERGVDFALLLRVGGGDLQSAAVFEPRTRLGRFW